MKNVRKTGLWSVRSVIGIAVTLLVAGCASQPLEEAKPEPAFRTDAAVCAPAPAPLAERSRIATLVDKKIKRSKGDQVLISKKLLKELVSEQRVSEAQRERLSGQLEALKKVDRESSDGSHPIN